jgi:hypothetical protein
MRSATQSTQAKAARNGTEIQTSIQNQLMWNSLPAGPFVESHRRPNYQTNEVITMPSLTASKVE